MAPNLATSRALRHFRPTAARHSLPARCFLELGGRRRSGMDVDRMRRVDAVLDAVLTREPTQWPALLDETCSGDAELRREVEALLARVDTASRFLESPPGAVAAALIAEMR